MLTPERQKELVAINRVLAALVVVLAFSTGLLWGSDHGWFSITPPTSSALITDLEQPAVALPPVPSTPLKPVLENARPQRDFLPQDNLTLSEIASLAWSAQGEITEWGERTVPSYKASFPLQVYVLLSRDQEIGKGLYRYDSKNHTLLPVIIEDFDAFFATLHQPSVITAPITVLVAGPLTEFPEREAMIAEAGGVIRNVMLMATSLGLGSVPLMPSTTPTLNTLIETENMEIIQILPVGRLQSEV